MSLTHSWQKSRTAQFSARVGPSGVVIAAHGELDAANANQLADYVERWVRPTARLTLDLRGLEFIGTAGFSTLHRINVVCSNAGSHWSMMPGRVVSRLLRVCDPEGTLPITATAGEVFTEPVPTDGEPPATPALLQLVPQPR